MPKGCVTVSEAANRTSLPRSPFDGHPAGDHLNAAGQIGVRLQAGILPSVTQVSTWISGLAGLEQALAGWLGAQPPVSWTESNNEWSVPTWYKKIFSGVEGQTNLA